MTLQGALVNSLSGGCLMANMNFVLNVQCPKGQGQSSRTEVEPGFDFELLLREWALFV